MTEANRHRLIAALACLGGAAVSAGAMLRWLTVFHGLHSYAGTVGLNGRLLAAGGAATIPLALAYALRPRPRLRYAIALLGFALALFSAYLLAQLLATYRSLTGFFLPALGPGVFVAAAGAILIVATLLIDTEPGRHRPHTNRLDSPAVTLIALSAGAGAIHLAVASDHFHEYLLFGAFFVALGSTQVAWAALIALRGPGRWLLLAATANGAVVALWIVSRTSGLPLGPDPWVPEPIGFPDLTATLFELVLVASATWSLRHPRRQPRRAIGWLAWALPLAISPATIAAILAAVGAAGPA